MANSIGAYGQSTNDIGAYESAAGGTTLTAEGTPSIASPTSSGVAKRNLKTATAAVAMAAVVATGTASIGPKVHLNTTQTLTAATEMNVTSYSQDGTSITFTDPAGAPTGSLNLGVENRNLGGGDANTAWIAVTVNSTTKTASGTPDTPILTASGVAASPGTETAQGTPSISSPTSTAIVNVFSGTDGTPTLAVITASGVANVSGTKTVTGTPSLTEITASGTAVETSTKAASGTPLLTEITASGVASKITTATGTSSLSAITSSGTASRAGARATGTPQLPTITTTNTVAHHVIATSATSISAVSASGVASGTGTRTASGTPSLTEITASASVRIPGSRNYGFIVTPPKRYHIVKDRPYIAKS